MEKPARSSEKLGLKKSGRDRMAVLRARVRVPCFASKRGRFDFFFGGQERSRRKLLCLIPLALRESLESGLVENAGAAFGWSLVNYFLHS